MKTVPPALFLTALLAVNTSFGQPGTNQPSRRFPLLPGVKVLKDLKYGRGSGRAMLLDLYLPENTSRPLPLIIWIHGGAWMAGSKDDPSPALHFTTEGYAVAQVGYRLSQEAKSSRHRYTTARRRLGEKLDNLIIGELDSPVVADCFDHGLERR